MTDAPPGRRDRRPAPSSTPPPAPLRRAAQQALGRLSQAPATGEVRRVVLDVTVAGKTEMVSVALRDGQLNWASTDPDDERHVRIALEFLAGGGAGRTSQPPAEASDQTQVHIRPEPSDSGRPSRMAPRVVEDARPETFDHERLAAALEDTVLAVVRAGADQAASAPAVAEAMEQLVAAAPAPLPLGVERWIGRVWSAVAGRDVQGLSRALHGACRVMDDLREPEPSDEAWRRIISWLGTTAHPAGTVETMTERSLVEIARETLPGRARGAIERRYLVDLASAEIFREERARGDRTASIGPCPRRLDVGLGEVEQGAPVRRIRLMQYAVSADLTTSVWRRVAAASVRSFRLLVERYQIAMGRFPGLAEPFGLIAPTAVARDHGLVLQDVDGYPLPLARAEAPAATATMELLLGDQLPYFVAGRLVDAEGALMLVPLSYGVLEGGKTRLVRLA